MLQTFKNAWKIAELRNKILFTLGIIVLFRFGSVLPVPFVNSEVITGFGEGSIFTLVNIFSGGAFQQATLFALSISPYITASIVIQLLTIAIPALERLSKEGPEGRKKLTQITRYSTVALALITSFGYYTYLKSMPGVLIGIVNPVFEAAVIISSYCAGAAIIMWLAEKINDHGIGNGISIILFANIVTSLPGMISQAISVGNGLGQFGFLVPVLVIVLFMLMIMFVVFVTNAERKLPVQYAKRQDGRRMYGGQNTYIPMKLNMSGVMPIIFASSIAAIPSTLALIIKPEAGSIWSKIVNLFSSTSPVYMIIYFVLIIGFAYFYLAISFNPVEVANNIKNNGGSVPGIRPGKPTVDYITKILGRITLIGAIFLGIVATLPLIVGMVNPNLSNLAFGGSSLLILVSVALETEKELEAQMTMRHYKGFLE